MIIFSLIVRRILDLLCHNEPSPSPAPEPKPFPTEAEIDAALAARGLKDKNSIVDLLDALKIRNDFHTRGALYVDLAGPREYTGSAEQNTWLIQQVRLRFAEGRLD